MSDGTPTKKRLETTADDVRVESVSINPFWDIPELFTSPPRKGIKDRVQVRVNGVLLNRAVVEKGWLVYRPDARLFAVGQNLIGIVVAGRAPGSPPMTVEKVEARVKYCKRNKG